MSSKTEEKLKEAATWYYYHYKSIDKDNLQKRVEFMEKIVDNLFLLFTYVYEDVKKLETGRTPPLILPHDFGKMLKPD